MEENIVRESNAEEIKPEEQQLTGGVQKGWILSILYALGLIALMLGIQVTLGIAGAVVEMAWMLISSGGDTEQVMANYQEEVMNNGFLTTISVIATLVTTTLFGLWYKLKYVKHYDRKQFCSTMKEAFTVPKTVYFVLVAVTCYVLAINIVNVINFFSSESVDAYMQVAESLTSGNGVLSFLLIVVLAPIGEECLVRGLIQRRLGKYFPIIGVLVLETLFFGLMHANIVQALYVIPLGAATGYLSYRYKSVLPAILFHAFYNFTPRIIALLPETITNQDLTWYIAAAVLTVCAVVLWQPVMGKEQRYVDED